MTDPVDEEQPIKKHGLFTSIRNSFFAGVVVALPIGLTVWLITTFVGFVDKSVLPWFPKQLVELIPASIRNLQIPGLGIIISAIALWGLGVIATNFFGSRLLRFGERILARVPVVSNIYNAVKQIVVTMAQQKERAFRDVCLLEYPRKGLWAIGFVTADLDGAPAKVLPKGHVCVFVPTTPNPTSGFLLFVPIKDITILDMTPEEGAKMIISGGMVTSNEDLKDVK